MPVWYLGYGKMGHTAVLLHYKEWDSKPTVLSDGDAPGDPPKVETFEFTTAAELEGASSADATPGEFDLLDARNLMERGDYTGAVRRTVTAIRAIVEWALRGQLEEQYSAAETERRLAASENDFPGRFRQWLKLAQPGIGEVELKLFETTRETRHRIVHRGVSLTHKDRGDRGHHPLPETPASSSRTWAWTRRSASPGQSRRAMGTASA